MKILDLLIFDLIIEGVEDVEKIYDTYYAKIPKNRFAFIAKIDPNTKFAADGRVENLGKYARLLLNLYLKDGLKVEDFELAREYVKTINKHNIKLDWAKIKDLSDVYPYVQKYLAVQTEKFHDILQYLDEGRDYEKAFDGSQYEIYVPMTEKGACYLGVGSEWCTTWGPMSLNDRNKSKTNRFANYNSEGTLYVIVSKKDPTQRVQWHFENKEFKNLQNGNVDPKKYLESSEELLNFFFPLSPDMSDQDFERLHTYSHLFPRDHYKKLKALYSAKHNINIDEVLYVDPANFFPAEFMTHVIDRVVNDVDLEKNGRLVLYTIPMNERMINTISEIYRYISTLIYEKDNIRPSEYMFDGYEKGLEERIRDIFREFYDKHKPKIFNMFGALANNFDDLSVLCFDKIMEGIREEYLNEYDRKNYGNVEDAYNLEIGNFHKHLKINRTYDQGYELNFNLGSFNKFNMDKEVKTIDSLNEYLEGFCNHFDLNYSMDFYESPQVDYEDVDLDKLESNIFDIMDDLSEQYIPEAMDKFFYVKNKFFDEENKYEDKNKSIELDMRKLDFKDGEIKIKYLNKKTGQKYDGNIKMSNLANYVTMDMLAETYFKVKMNPRNK